MLHRGFLKTYTAPILLGLSLFLQTPVLAAAQSLNQLSNAIPATGGSSGSVNINEIELRNSLLDFGWKVILYAALVFAYWLVLRVFLYFSHKMVKSEPVFRLLRITGTAIFLISALVTILFAFVGNLSFLITSFGVLSAALVVALQDFVSSFFAWMMVKVKHQYKKDDIIQLNSSKGSFTGKVVEVGVFRTSLKEQVGGHGLDKEFYTGKIVSFPNNLILKEGLVNFTLDNKILWHDINLTVTFESDYEKAKLILEEIADKQFSYFIDHKDSLLDDVFNLKTLYKPKIFMNIGENGVDFTIHFSARRDRYRESLEEYSRQILHKFKLSDISLAYRTSRVLSSTLHVNSFSSN